MDEAKKEQERIITNLLLQECLSVEDIIKGTGVSRNMVLEVRKNVLFERYCDKLVRICDMLEKVRLEGRKCGEARMIEKFVVHLMEVNPDMILTEACKILGIQQQDYFEALKILEG